MHISYDGSQIHHQCNRFLGIRGAGNTVLYGRECCSSIALDSQDTVHISYYGWYDISYDYLEYVTNVTGSWEREIVDSNNGWVGICTSLAVDSQDKVHIGYDDGINGDLKYAKKCLEMDSDCDDVLDNEENRPHDYNPSQKDSYPPQTNNCGDVCDCEGNFDYDSDQDGSDAASFKRLW